MVDSEDTYFVYLYLFLPVFFMYSYEIMNKHIPKSLSFVYVYPKKFKILSVSHVWNFQLWHCNIALCVFS